MRFVIELRYTDDGVHGHVASDAAPEPQPFVGWLELLRLLVEQQVQVAEARPRHVPVEAFGLEVERKVVSQRPVERADQRLLRSVRCGGSAMPVWKCPSRMSHACARGST